MPEKIKGIVRIAGADIKGEEQLFTSLQKIRGVGAVLANAVCRVNDLNLNRKVGTLNKKEIEKIEKTLKNPKQFGIPSWILNRRKEPEIGEDKHLVGGNLTLTQKQDIKKMIKIRSYRGVRHMFGLPVRGQRTKGSFRKGRTVGVVRKKARPATKKK